jgi:hypothetical protein
MTTVAVEECGKEVVVVSVVHADALSMTSASDNTTRDDSSRSDCFMSYVWYNPHKGKGLMNYCKIERRGERKKGKRRERGREGKERGKEGRCNFDYY